jgi:DAACS family dicarboxylate/amino acid:cation (Na+ or H+) symporter
LLLLNTLVAITVGLTVANVIQPGQGAGLTPPSSQGEATHTTNPLALFLENVPKSLLGPLGDDGKVIGVIFIAVAFGMALRKERERPLGTVGHLVELFLESLIKILHWIIALVPFAVFGIVASIVGTEGFAPFKALGIFVLSVLLALAIQGGYYLVRIRFSSWVRPADLIRGGRDARKRRGARSRGPSSHGPWTARPTSSMRPSWTGSAPARSGSGPGSANSIST